MINSNCHTFPFQGGDDDDKTRTMTTCRMYITTVDHHLFRSASGIPPIRKGKRKPKILLLQRETPMPPPPPPPVAVVDVGPAVVIA
jgi:hypothetical protein